MVAMSMKTPKTSAKAAKALKQKKAAAMKEKKAAAMKATKAMKENKKAEEPMPSTQILKKCWSSSYRGKYYDWQLKSIVRQGDQVKEEWAGKLLPAAERG
jgi:biotin carboxyl carrier protein